MDSDTLVAFGDAVKFLDDDETRVGGYLVRFTTKSDPDLVGDYFTADTDFGRDEIKSVEMPLHYEHGMDPDIGKARIGNGTIEKRDAGLWYEAQVQISDQYRDYIRQLVRDGRLGYSSGAVAHLVDREPAGKTTNRITRWPIGEASLTPRPAEPRNIVNLKSLIGNASSVPEDAAKGAEKASPTSAVDVEPVDTPVPVAETVHAEPPTQMEQETPNVPTFTADDVSKMVDDKIKAFQESQVVVKNASAPAIITVTGDTQRKAIDRWVRTGDTGAVKSILSGQNQIDIDLSRARKASNNTDMNVGTAADGGDLVTDDMANRIVAKMTEARLSDRLGVRRFTGVGTTLDVPVDNEADGEFVSTNEAASFDRDAPALTQTVLTLVKYTKKIQVSHELMQDTATNLFEFLADWVGRGLAKTHNDLLVNEVQTNGSELDIAGTATFSLGDLENAAFGSDVAYYLDDSGSVGWVMKPATFGAILSLGGTSNRYYSSETGLGNIAGPSLLGYPVFFSNKVDAYGNGQPVLFGNWNYVGLYESPTLQVLRDEYSSAANGQVNFHYYTRCDYGVLQSGAIGYVRHGNT